MLVFELLNHINYIINMKKFLHSVFMLIASVFVWGLVSCSSDDAKVMQSDEKTNFKELNSSLQSYTKEFEASHSKIIETRFLGLKRF